VSAKAGAGRLLRALIGPLLGLLLLAASAWGVAWADLGAALAGARLGYVLLALLSVLLTHVAKALRWKALCKAASGVPARRFIAGIVVGQMVNAALPGRAGDLARIATLGREAPLGYALALGSVVAEKALDGLVLLALVLGLLPLAPAIAGLQPLPIGISVGVSSGTLLLGLWLVRLAGVRAWLVRCLRRLPGRLVGPWGERIEAGLERFAASSWSDWRPWAWSALIWLLAALTNQLAFLAFGLRLAWSAAPVLLVVLHLGRLIGVTPGQVGIFHALCILVLSTYGVSHGPALAYALVLHLIVVGTPMVWGLLVLRGEGAQWMEWLRAARQWAGRQMPQPDDGAKRE